MQDGNQAMQQVPGGQQPQGVRISSKEFAAKYRSKREVYNFLATDVGIYLPPYDNVTSKCTPCWIYAPRLCHVCGSS